MTSPPAVSPPRALRADVVPGDGLLHPIPLLALVVLVLNDHRWKHAFHNGITGKLSDVAGMVFFPLLLQAAGEMVLAGAGRPWGPSRRALLVAVIATGVVFGLAKTWVPATELVRTAAGLVRWPWQLAGAALRGVPAPPPGHPALVRDPTDLLALPALGMAIVAARRRHPRSPGRD